MVGSPRSPLPIDACLPQIAAELRATGSLVLQAPPGAGKTTRVPASLLEQVEGSVVVLEPRRIAARLSAQRVAFERGERVGETIGFEVRFERAMSRATRLSFVTEGVFTRKIVAQPDLPGVGLVVLDEFHERHLQGDLALALVQRLRATTRPDLQVIVMSATLDAQPVATLLGAPIVTSEGRAFPVVIEHAERADDRPLELQVASTVRRVVHEEASGDVLVFLPGAAEIRRAIEACARLGADHDLLLLPLHGELAPDAQERALVRADRRKVIFATNVAETSVTIDGVTVVIDSGLARVAGFDPWTGRATLDVRPIARSSATQRAGRAGRTAPGRAIRLYSRGDHDARPAHAAPEIHRTDLTETCLQLAALGVANPRALPWLDPPLDASVEAATTLLRRLGALDHASQLTPIGRSMSRLALPPRLARMLLEGEARGVADAVAGLAAIVAEGRSLRARGSFHAARDDDRACDLRAELDLLDEAMRDGRLDMNRLRAAGLDAGVATAIDRQRRQLVRASGGAVAEGHGKKVLPLPPALPAPCDPSAVAPMSSSRRESRGGVRRGGGFCSAPEAHARTATEERAISMSILAAFPDRVASRRRSAREEGRVAIGREFVLTNGGSATQSPESGVRTAPFIVAVEARDREGRPLITAATAIEPEWLLDLFADDVREEIDVRWRADLERVEATERMTFGAVTIDERPGGSAARDALSAELFTRAIAAGGIDAVMGAATLTELRNRLDFVLENAPDLAERAALRRLDDALLSTVLKRACDGRRSFAELRALHLLEEVRGAFGHAALARLDALAPEHVTLANGRRVQVAYARGERPSIGSRLQDFFGATEGPRVLERRVPLVLHLHAPNGRDVQVTSDLEGFWTRAYPAVRSELMRRYPRHSWPVDPRSAAPPLPRR